MWKERKRYISEERIKSEPKKRESYEDSKYPFEVVLVLVRFNILCEAFKHVCAEWHVFISQKRINKIFGQGGMGAI